MAAVWPHLPPPTRLAGRNRRCNPAGMAGQHDDDESDDEFRSELIAARDDLHRQIELLNGGMARGGNRTPDFDDLTASLTGQLQQIETELAKYSDVAGPAEESEQAPVDSGSDSEPEAEPQPEPDPEPEAEPDEIDPKPVATAPIEFHTDAPDGPPNGGQFWTFAGLGVVGLLVLGLLLRIFSMLWAHLMGHST
jgi:hypothetical protein